MNSQLQASILLVDDYPENLLALEGILQGQNYSLVRATSGEEALKYLLHENFAVILLDVKMPGMDGLETARLIRQRERNSHVPIVFLTAYSDDTPLFEGYSLGAIDYLFKPLQPSILLAKVRVLVELYQKRVEVVQQSVQLKSLNEKLLASLSSLQDLNERLEQKVEERTHELRHTNQILYQEILERQRVEEELRDSQQALLQTSDQISQILESINEGFYALDRNCHFTYINQKAARLLGKPPEALIGKNIWEEVPEAIGGKAYQEILRVLAEGGSSEFEIICPVLQDWICERIYANPSGVSILLHDISRRKQAEAELQQAKAELEVRVAERTAQLMAINSQLRESEALFRSLSECLPIGIFKSDANGKNIYTNPYIQILGGFTFNEALGYGWLKFVYPEEREPVFSQWSESVSKRSQFSREMRFVHRDGRISYVWVQAVPIFDHENQLMGYVGTAEDVTETHALEQMKSEFISIVSHELRTPLASIRGALGLLASGTLKNKPEMAHRLLDIAVNDTERLVHLVNDILDLDRLESHKLALNCQWYEIAYLMRQASDMLQPIAKANGILIHYSSPPGKVWADSERIIQTLANLLSNAVKFSSPGTAISLSAEMLADRVVFHIKDQGSGIPQDKLETIFGRFQQVDASDSRQKGGTGLGLAICRSIVQQHGGSIWVESVLGEGSTFSFSLPLPLD